MNIIKLASKIVNKRDKYRGTIQKRSMRYICSGIDIKIERLLNVLDKARMNHKLNMDDKDTIIDIFAYLLEFSRRIK